MKELLEGRRFGFALRPPLGGVAVGLGIGVLLLDVMSWAGWGAQLTNGLVAGSAWLSGATTVVCVVGLLTALAEMRDIAEEEMNLARLDALGALAASVLYLLTTVARVGDSGAAAASPLALLLEIAGLIALLAGATLSSILYAGREWEEVEEIVHERQRRRRVAGR